MIHDLPEIRHIDINNSNNDDDNNILGFGEKYYASTIYLPYSVANLTTCFVNCIAGMFIYCRGRAGYFFITHVAIFFFWTVAEALTSLV